MDFLRDSRVLLEDEDLETDTGPGEMIAHTANGVGLDHSLDASLEQGGYGEFGVRTVSVLLGNDEFGFVHEGSIRLGGEWHAVAPSFEKRTVTLCGRRIGACVHGVQ